MIWEQRDSSWSDIKSELYDRSRHNKIQQTVTFLKKVELIDSDHQLLPNGVWLANNFESAPQTTISQGVQLGSKETLSNIEQTIFRQLLFQYDTLPMLATIYLISTKDLSDKETEERSLKYKDCVKHLKKYNEEWRTGTWKKKSQVHYEWAKQLELANVNDQRKLELTELGDALHQGLGHMYHPEW